MSKKKEEEKESVMSLALQSIGSQVTVQDLLEGGAIPSNLDSKEKVVTVIQHGKELGLEPMTALCGIHVIKGRTVISAAVLGALLKKSGYEFVYTKDYDTSEDPSNAKTEVTLYWMSKTLGREMSASFEVSWKQFVLAEYTTKPNWKKMPKEMMRARCIAGAVRAIAPEVLLGIYTADEIIDSDKGTGKEVDFDEDGNQIIVDTEYEEVD